MPVFLPDAVDFALFSEFEERREFKAAQSVTKLQQKDRQVTMWPSSKERLRSLSNSRESCSISASQELSFTSVSEEIYTDVSGSEHPT